MGELEEKLENILGNPQAMAQIMSLAQSLNLGGPGQAAQEQGQNPPQPPSQDGQPGENGAAPAPSQDAQSRQGGTAPAPSQDVQSGQSGAAPAPSPPPVPPGGGGQGLGSLLGALGGLDSGTLSAAAGLIGQFADGGDDRRTALLSALRPYVREERYAKLDKAIQIAKLSRLIRSGLELFRARKEDGHV